MSKLLTIDFSDREKAALDKLLSREEYRIKRSPDKESQAISGLLAKISKGSAINRVDARILQRVCENNILLIRTQTQPELDRRVDQFPESAKKYEPYIKKLDEQLEVLIQLSDKIGALL